MKAVDDVSPPNLACKEFLQGLETAVPLPSGLENGMEIFKQMLAYSSSFEGLGRCMLWMFANFSRLEAERNVAVAVQLMVLGKARASVAMHRGQAPGSLRPLIPLPLGDLQGMLDIARVTELQDFCNPHFAAIEDGQVWTALTVLGLNGAAGHGRVGLGRQPTASQRDALLTISSSVQRVLPKGFKFERTAASVEKELASRYLSYSGEEVPKMQVLRLRQALAALPPKGHGGCVDARDFVTPGTRWFLEHPEESLLVEPTPGVKLQAKVHVPPNEAVEFFSTLVDHGICNWVLDEEVLRVGTQPVLSGMFAVGKGSFMESGDEVQRVIMNLIPCNAAFRHCQGGTKELPSISQYLSLVLAQDERLAFFQSDMTSAFYLFRLPVAWQSMMAFNVCFSGEQIGRPAGQIFRPACAVIPMGWASAVAIMQEIAERLTTIARLPRSHRVRRTAPLPVWLTETCEKSVAEGKAWFHVYLDNYCGMQRLRGAERPELAEQMHAGLEAAWKDSKVLSSEKKRVSGESTATELGAYIHGTVGTMGPSSERLLKLLQTTLLVISKRRLKKKWIQVVAGRWTHCMSFRRPFMVFLDATWQYISGKATSEILEAKVRSEVVGCCCACLVCHANLRAGVSQVTTASDASSTGGAVGKSTTLTPEGNQFAAADMAGLSQGRPIPVLVLSLFNGIGCAFRCYDLCGVCPQVSIAYDLSKEANRVTSRRWPQVQIEQDVRSITPEVVQSWRYLHPSVEEIHIWGGFPCTDLCSAKYGRQNLAGSQSSLFYELVRIIKLVKRTYGFSFKVIYAAENVASMDEEAEQQITAELGVRPWRMDPADVAPIHRPRYCWTNAEFSPMDGVSVAEKDRWLEITMEHDYPALSQWLEDGAEWPGFWEGAILPTCMKSIRRVRPPPRPAGLDRVSYEGQLRWAADEFRFPPYHYAERFLIWVGQRWRLISSSERELLHGLGYNHTELCWNANQIKQNPKGYEDARKSLVGDSFSCFSFAYVCAMMCAKWINIPSYEMLWNRMGLSPGFCPPLHVQAPLQRCLCYGHTDKTLDVAALHSALLRRVNHTGSDIRVSTGAIINPKAYPRQSACSSWWKWSKVFACRWARSDHINSLELRSIVHSLEWRIRHLNETQLRVVHLTDSYVAMAIISKGRTSANLLKPLLARLAVLLLAWDLQLLVGHVESTDNPTDHASRL